jgi:hypothetical protein
VLRAIGYNVNFVAQGGHMKPKGKMSRPWKETRVDLASATALLLDGPGSEWLLLVRGERTQPARAVRRSAKGGRS